jgi:hypothetical protein
LAGHPHFVLTITFAFDLGMPFSIWVFWVLLLFGFLIAFYQLSNIEMSFAPIVGMWS